ncbi:MAG TPA: helix-turn-helix transcriptional regulator [Longimicrobiales bacterium]|nr:helix-turn-helix transcriptional regulator [Longimicrobiales bacterium]
MRLWWNYIWRSDSYRRGTATQRRLIELRFNLALRVKRCRKLAGVSQRELARRCGYAPATVSKVERASSKVTLDVAVKCLLVLGCGDEEIARAFDVRKSASVQHLRQRTAKGYPKPRLEEYEEDDRFVWRGELAGRRLLVRDIPREDN